MGAKKVNCMMCNKLLVYTRSILAPDPSCDPLYGADGPSCTALRSTTSCCGSAAADVMFRGEGPRGQNYCFCGGTQCGGRSETSRLYLSPARRSDVRKRKLGFGVSPFLFRFAWVRVLHMFVGNGCEPTCSRRSRMQGRVTP